MENNIAVLKIDYNSEQPTVLGRDLHEALEVKSRYNDWFKNMCAYGFDEGKDYVSFTKNLVSGGRQTDHQLTIPMAKEICMLQRTDKGKEFRKYFIKIEEQWNTPEIVMARALKLANKDIGELKLQNAQLLLESEIQQKELAEIRPKAKYCDIVLQSKDLTTTTVIAKDYGMSARKFNSILNELGIQYKKPKTNTWLLYSKYADKNYTGTKTYTYNGNNGKIHVKINTCWTQNGRMFLYNILKQTKNLVPMIEQETTLIQQGTVTVN